MKNYSILFLLLCCVFTLFAAQNKTLINSEERIISLPGFGKVKGLELAGYLPISDSATPSGNLFYWYVENRSPLADSPLVLWLNGGPGAVSMYGFFMENGPYIINKDGTLSERRYSWSQKANYLVIDQPAGVGFSYGEKNTYLNESEAMDQLYYAIQFFFQHHPELASKPFYLAGESYAGKYLPQLAMRIITGNTGKQKIQLKGLLVGDAWVNPRLQQLANADYAYSHGLIDRNTQEKVLKLYHQCIKEIDKRTPSTRRANQTCEKIQALIIKESGGLNLANISKGVEPDDSTMIKYLNTPEVRQALHVDPRVQQFKTFSERVAKRLEIGEQDSVANLYPVILAAGVRVLIYNGLEDGKDSNFMSTDLWLSELNWPFKKEFANTARCVWHVDHQVAGYAKSAGGLTQVKIRHAGHLAPIDQPARLLDLFNHFISDQALC
ncbi:S10 family peptidase [Legionella maioricensis]|uniref:S10 family peptidase n=1 Tax=Legionella maioricensis TaxID=2896528 RepID=A0A9X2D3V6_9GAMM|nr:S10 family peptidase [Legionella maioricensis]MCL9685560.1 S10 family peptidase [Legionella maioricensis]MCL9688880.1 S10 family peptidase [Legionella maioricensis]